MSVKLRCNHDVFQRLPRSSCSRQEVFSVKGERITAAQMEALEEVFRRVQFDTLDFEYTFLDDDVWCHAFLFIG